MTSQIRSSTLRAAAEAVRVLVSPMTFTSIDDWRRAVHDVLRKLLNADQTITFIPHAGEFVLSHDLDESALRTLRTWMSGFTPDGRLNTSDPVVNEWNDRRRELGLQIYSRGIINHAINGRVLKSPFVNEALIPNSMRYWEGTYAKGPGNTDALLWASHSRVRNARNDSSTESLLHIVAPAFQAGLSSLYRLEGARTALDAADVPILVFDSEGRNVHASAAFSAQVTGSDAAAVISRSRELARRITGELVRTTTASGPPPVSAQLRGSSTSYSLRATLLRDGTFGSSAAVAVVVTRSSGVALPSVPTLIATHRLTQREAEVALHLAAGASRKEIAAALVISPHTARAHTEKVFQKLGVTTRSAVAAAILQGRASS